MRVRVQMEVCVCACVNSCVCPHDHVNKNICVCMPHLFDALWSVKKRLISIFLAPFLKKLLLAFTVSKEMRLAHSDISVVPILLEAAHGSLRELVARSGTVLVGPRGNCTGTCTRSSFSIGKMSGNSSGGARGFFHQAISMKWSPISSTTVKTCPTLRPEPSQP